MALTKEETRKLWMSPGNSFLSLRESTNKVTQSVCGKLRAQLDNLRGIAWLYANHLGIHRPKENDNYHKDSPVGAETIHAKVAMLIDRQEFLSQVKTHEA